MKTLSLNSGWSRSSAWARGVALVSLAAGAWALSMGTAHARGDRDGDVYWSVGVSTPGVNVGVSNAPPPVVVHPRPVIVHPQPYPYVRPVVVVPQPVYYGGRGHGPRWHKRQARHHHRWHARHGHRDDYRYDDRHDRRGDRGDGRRDGRRY